MKNNKLVKRGPVMDIKDDFYDQQLHVVNGKYDEVAALQTAVEEFASNLSAFQEVEVALHKIIESVTRYEALVKDLKKAGNQGSDKLSKEISNLKYGIIALLGNAFRYNTDDITDAFIEEFDVKAVKSLTTKAIKSYMGSNLYEAAQKKDTRVLLNAPYANNDVLMTKSAKDIRDKTFNASHYYMMFQVWVLGANDFKVGLMNTTIELAKDPEYRKLAKKHGFSKTKIRKTMAEKKAEKVKKVEGMMYDTK